MILDKAPNEIRIFDTEWVDDGYGGGRDPRPAPTFITVRAFVMPTGFAGAGWAQNMRFEGQGWADTGRITIVVKALPEVERRLRVWAQVEAQGRRWTVVQAPRLWETRRMRFFTALCELKDEGQ